MKKKIINTTKYIICLMLLSAFVLYLAGCAGKHTSSSAGGGNSVSFTDSSAQDASSVSQPKAGNLKIDVAWPQKKSNGAPHQAVQGTAKVIPTQTQSITLSVTGLGLTAARTATITSGTSSVTISNLPAGTKQLEISALSSENTLLAHRIVDFVISSGQTTNVSATLGVSIVSSTVNSNGFVPATITLAAGDTLYWVNNDTSAHRIIETGGAFDYTIAAGASQAHTFNTVGTYNYYDNADPGKRGYVVVKAAPAISSIAPSSGTYGTSVTINGQGFGGTQGTSNVTFGGIAAAVTSWTATQIVCTVPVYSGTGQVAVIVGGQSSNTAAFTINSPSVTNVAVNFGAAGESVIITGTNFGSQQYTSTVKFNGTSATVTSWSNTSITCTVPASTTGDITVTVAGVSANAGTFTYAANGWAAQASGTTYDVNDITFVDTSNGFAIARESSSNTISFRKTTDGGANWSQITSAGVCSTADDVFAYTAGQVWFSGWWAGPTALYYTVNNGTTWSSTQPMDVGIFGIYMMNELTGWFCGSDRVGKTTNGGSSVTVQLDDGSSAFQDIYFTDFSNGWVVGNSGVIKRTSNGGTDWSSQTSGTTQNLRRVWFTSATNGWIVGEGGVVLYTTDGGTNWSSKSLSTNENLYGLWIVNNCIYICGGNGRIFMSSDGGAGWVSRSISTSNTFYGITFADKTHGWVCGQGGAIYKYD